MPFPWGAAIGAATTLGSAIFGASQQGKAERSAKKAQKKAEKAQERAIERQYGYDKKAWEMTKEQLTANRDDAIRSIDLAKKNESIIAQYKDATAEQNYQYSLQIRNLQQKQLNDQYTKSEQLYATNTSLNKFGAAYAKEQQARAVREEAQKFAFANQDSILENLLGEATARARGQAGRSARKAAQSQLAALGRNQAGMAESLVSLQTNAAAALRQIDMQHLQADLNAFSARMLPPDEIPAPVIPFKTPLTEYQYPRELQEFDFGPKPIKGAMASATGGAGGGWANAFAAQLPQVAQAVTPLVSQLFQPSGTNFGQFGNYAGQSMTTNIPFSGRSGFNTGSNLGIANTTGMNLNKSFFG
jgi:hypothetical protein